MTNPGVGRLLLILTIFNMQIIAYAQAEFSSGNKRNISGSSLKEHASYKGDTVKNKSEKESDDVIKIETNLVKTDVLVLNQRGIAVLGLNKDDFIVKEDNIPQTVGTFSLGDSMDVPRSIVLIIDYSSSQQSYIEMSVEAAKRLVDKLNPKDRMAIVTDDVKLLADYTHDKDFLRKKLDNLKNKSLKLINGKSRQYEALMATLNKLFDEEDIRPMVIFQTDGDQVFEIKSDKPQEKVKSSRRQTEFTVTELFKTIDKSRATIYSIISGYSVLGLSLEKVDEKLRQNVDEYNGLSEESKKNYMDTVQKQQTAMMIVARVSGGFTSSLEYPSQADKIYTEILEENNSRYLLGYYSTNEVRDGKRRALKITVRDHPEYVVRGRSAYFAPKAE